MAHLDENGNLVPCEKVWTRSAEYGRNLKRLVAMGQGTLDEALRRIDRPERNEVFRALFACTDEQLDQLETLCPLGKDLTIEVFKGFTG